jgi:hypothetical protein
MTRTALNSLNEGVDGVRAWANLSLLHSRVGMGAGIAMLAAPLFLKNDERGYFQTAAMTTPLIAAGAMVAPRLFPTLQREGKRLIDVVKQVPTDYGFQSGVYNAESGAMNLSELRQAFEGGRISSADYNRGLLRYHGDIAASVISPDEIDRQFLSASRTFSELYKDPTKHRMLENALYRATLSQESAGEKAAWNDLTAVAPKMSLNEIDDLFDAYSKNPDWLKQVNYRMQEARKATTSGATIPSIDTLVDANAEYVHSYSLDTDQGMAMLKNSPFQDEMSEIETLLGTQGAGWKRSDFELQVLPDRNQAVNRIQGLMVRGELSIPFADADGGVRLGSRFDRHGASRFFITHNDRLSSQVYALRGLQSGPAAMPSVAEELARAQFNIQGDAGALRNQKFFFGKQGVMGNLPNSFPTERGAKGFADLRPEEMMAAIKHQTEGPDGLVRMSGGTGLDIYEDRSLRLIEPQGVHSREAESLRGKAVNKGVSAWVAPGHEGFSATNAVDLPEFAMRTYQVSGSQHAFFSEMPEWKAIENDVNQQFGYMEAAGFGGSSALEEEARQLSVDVALSKIGARERMITFMAGDAGVGMEAAEAMYTKFLPFLANPKNYEAMRSLSYLGDGSRIMGNSIGAGFTQTRSVRLHESLLTEGMLNGETIPEGTPLGFEYGNAVFPNGERNKIVSHSSTFNEDGSMTFQIEENLGSQGLKTHGYTKQTTVLGLNDLTLDRVRRGTNAWHQATGSGGVVDERVAAFTLEGSNSAKAKNPLSIMENMLGATLGDVQQANGELPDFLNAGLKQLSPYGYSFENGGLLSDSSKFLSMEHAPANYTAVAEIMHGLMEQTGAAIKAEQIKLDASMRGYIDWSMKNSNGSYTDYKTRFGMPESLSVSDHMALNHAGEVRITRDALQQLNIMGYHEVAKEINGRLQTDGLPGMTQDFLKHIEKDGQDFSGQFGDTTVSLADAMGGSDLRLGTAAGRSGTIFDPKNPLAQKNYSVLANVEGKDYYIPALGREAFGGGANAYGTDGYSANTWEGQFKDVLQAAGGDKEPFEAKLKTYTDTVKQKVGMGKESVWRPSSVDPLGMEGRAASRASSLRYADGSVNPYEIGVGNRYLDLMAADDAAALRRGGSRASLLLRHPINAPAITVMKYDPRLDNTWDIGVDPLLQLIDKGDTDGDRMSAHLINGDHFTKEGFANFMKNEVHGSQSLQSSQVKFNRIFNGDEGPVPFKDWFAEAGEGARRRNGFATFAGVDVRRALMARTAGADVGMLSNTFELMETTIAHSNSIRMPAERLLAHQTLFDIVKQSSIAAQKLKKGDAVGDYTQLMAWNNKLRGSLADRSANGQQGFMKALMEGAEKFGKDVDINDEHVGMGIATQAELEAGSQINPYARLLEHKADLFGRVHSSFDPRQADAHKLWTMSAADAEKFYGNVTGRMTDDMLPLIQAAANRGSASNLSAAVLGAENEANKVAQFAGKARRAAAGLVDAAGQSAEEVMRTARGAGVSKVLGIGMAAAAAGGLLLGSLHSPREGQALAPPSGNAQRPEERIGVEDRIPGEPEPGAMAPANPPRMVRSARQGVRTSVVAPMGRATQLEVHMKADDRSRAAEAARLAARLASGDGNSSTTINYRDTTRLDSLRTRDKVREAMNES